eukprot:247390-Chlamydomonas_euryale.AAC.6
MALLHARRRPNETDSQHIRQYIRRKEACPTKKSFRPPTVQRPPGPSSLTGVKSPGRQALKGADESAIQPPSSAESRTPPRGTFPPAESTLQLEIVTAVCAPRGWTMASLLCSSMQKMHSAYCEGSLLDPGDELTHMTGSDTEVECLTQAAGTGRSRCGVRTTEEATCTLRPTHVSSQTPINRHKERAAAHRQRHLM